MENSLVAPAETQGGENAVGARRKADGGAVEGDAEEGHFCVCWLAGGCVCVCVVVGVSKGFVWRWVGCR